MRGVGGGEGWGEAGHTNRGGRIDKENGGAEREKIILYYTRI